tara:strand:+ start:361 stop:684 length:324 start_codon:yes stop_codon:yes gene_type:complete
MATSELFEENKEETFRISDLICAKLSKTEQAMLISRIASIREFRLGEITLEKLDEILLFTGNKVKEGVYRLEEEMYKGNRVIYPDGSDKSIRNLIEVSSEPLYDFKF